MKDGFDTGQTLAAHSGMSRAGDKQEIEGIRYKRFRRGGSRSKAKRADTVFPGEKPFVVPTIVSTPGLGLDDPVLQPGSVVLPTVEMGCWTALRQVTIGGRQAFAGNIPLVSFNRTDPASRAFDQLRTLLLQILRSNGWNRVAISAPTQGCGSTFTAVNLGLSFARIPGSRTVLMDLNLRTPGIAKALGIQSRGDARGYLSGQIDTSQYLVRVKDTLALGLAGSPDQDAAELLHDPRTGVALSSMSDDLRPDVTLFDLPPILAFDDLAAFLPQVDGVLLVADGTKTTAAHIKACQRILDGQTKVLGVTLNQARSAEQ